MRVECWSTGGSVDARKRDGRVRKDGKRASLDTMHGFVWIGIHKPVGY